MHLSAYFARKMALKSDPNTPSEMFNPSIVDFNRTGGGRNLSGNYIRFVTTLIIAFYYL